MGSLKMRIASIVDTWKYTWLRKVLDSEIPNREPHEDSYFISQFGEELGLIEKDAVESDKLMQHPRGNIRTLREKLWNIISVDNLVNDIYGMIRGNGLSDEEYVLFNSELKTFLNDHKFYGFEYYDDTFKYPSYDTLIKMLILLDVITHPDIVNQVWLKEIKTETKNEDYNNDYDYGGDYDDNDDNYNYDDNYDSDYGDDENYEYSDNEQIIEKVEEHIFEKEFKFFVDSLPNYLQETVHSLKAKNWYLSLQLKCKNNNLSYDIKSSNYVEMKSLIAIFDQSIRSIRSDISCVNLEQNYNKIYKDIVDKFYYSILYCPICNVQHDLTPEYIMCCNKDNCLEKYVSSKMGPSIEYELKQRPEYVDLIVSITYWALEEETFPERRDINFTPFPQQLINKGKRMYDLVKKDLDNLPSVDILLDMVNTGGLERYFHDEGAESEEIYYVLEWILSSNRTVMKLIKKENMLPHEIQINSHGGRLYKIVNPPEIEQKFLETKRERGLNSDQIGEWVYHSSNSKFWHGILRNGLKILSGTKYQTTGRVYGNGVYFSTDFLTSDGYSKPSNIMWPQSKFKTRKCIMVCEFIDHDNTDSLGTVYATPPHNFRIAREEKYFIPRYIIAI